jgi:serine/threonine protein kinase
MHSVNPMATPPTPPACQVVSLLGEGGFAKVFRGEWRGLVVAVKVVADDATNDKLVMKNAHEIAILAALSHPNIIQVRASAGA